MNENRYFKAGRFALVVKRDMAAGYRSILLTAVALGGVLFILTFLTGIRPSGASVHPGIWTGFLMAGGFITTSLMFKEMHSKERGHDWAMLPASRLEMFVSRLILSSLGWIIGFTALYWASSSLGEAVNRLVFGHGNALFNPFTRYTLEIALHYFIIQSVFLLGAAYFRKAHFIKTILFINVLNILLAALGLLLLKLFFWRVFTWDIFNENGDFSSTMGWINWDLVGQEAEQYFLAFARVMKIIYFSVFAPILWVVAYFRVKEKEVRNGI
ncbi:MAG: hypothetical protein JW760_00720 [Spirochaetales bacterium]|nr:hypothetical protein [Spirochaetales bacterium]